jgi:hypothetical protein
MTQNGFKLTADKMRRGNGLWTKVVRLHKSTIDQAGAQKWTPYWSLAVGREGEIRAAFCEEYRHAGNAHTAADDYISGRLSF